MGKWNYRRRWTPKNYYRDQWIPSPPTYYDTEFKLRGAWKNVDLPWEERFCISVGIAWEKVVNAKKYMYCYDNVVKWDDSAGEATFHDAKKRFWAKINGTPSDAPHPDSDMYIDEIDWNPKIDPELVKDLDEAYFNPDEAEKLENFDATKKNDDSLVPGCILGLDDKNPSNRDNPWECNKNANLNKKNISDPWEHGNTQDDREITDVAWGGGGSGSWHKDVTWGRGARNSGNNEIMWGGSANNSWHQNQHPSPRVDDISRNTWARGGRGNRNSCDQNGWERGDEFRRAAYADTSRGTQPGGAPKSRQMGEYRVNSLGYWRHNESGWDSNDNFRKREGSQQFTSSYKTARVQSDDYGAGNRWRQQRTQNRVNFRRE